MSKQRKPGLHDANRQPRSRARNSTTPAVAVNEEKGGSTLQRKPPGTEKLAVSNTENSVASVKQSGTSSAEEGTIRVTYEEGTARRRALGNLRAYLRVTPTVNLSHYPPLVL